MKQTHDDILAGIEQTQSVVCINIKELADLMYKVSQYRPDEFNAAVQLFNELNKG